MSTCLSLSSLLRPGPQVIFALTYNNGCRFVQALMQDCEWKKTRPPQDFVIYMWWRGVTYALRVLYHSCLDSGCVCMCVNLVCVHVRVYLLRSGVSYVQCIFLCACLMIQEERKRGEGEPARGNADTTDEWHTLVVEWHTLVVTIHHATIVHFFSKVSFHSIWLLIAFITWNSNLVPLPQGLCTLHPCRFGFSVF